MRVRAAVAAPLLALVLVGASAGGWSLVSTGQAAARAGTLTGNQPTATKSGSITISITVAWAPTTGATGYLVQRTGGVGSIGGTCTGTQTATTCTDTPVLPLQTYSYTITPLAGSWIGTPSPARTVTT